MSTRLQVVIDEQELERFQEVARVHGLTLSEWVRQTLRSAGNDVSTADVERKLEAIRKAAEYNFPAPDIDTMLSEIAAGYQQDLRD